MKLSTPYYEQVCAADFETFYSKEFGLRSKDLTMTDYIRDERFEMQTLSLQLDSWKKPKLAIGKEEAADLVQTVDWSKTAWLSHHTQFDGLIATHHLGVFPAFWLDTISMSRIIFGVDVSHSFEALSMRLGMKGKVRGKVLGEVKGKRLEELRADFPDLLKQLGLYNLDDTGDVLIIFDKLMKMGAISLDDLRIIDLTLRMYTEPVLELNEQVLRELHGREVERRNKAVSDAKTDKRTLGSSQRFANLLRSLGVTPPQKVNKKGNVTYAFARTDQAFKDLLDHPDLKVVAAVEARLRTKSALVENRSERLIRRVGLPTPVYLGYAAARTLRWGGGDKVNLQNLPSRGDGANLRTAIEAPEGCLMVVGDAAQIEARMNAWISNFQEKLDVFDAYDRGVGPDVYCVAGEGIFGYPIDKLIHEYERFMGKVYELAGGYGAGAIRMRNTLKIGTYGPPVDMELHEVKANLTRWRQKNQALIDNWGIQENYAKRAWLQGELVEAGCLTFELYKRDGYLHLPNGNYIKYPNVGYDEATRSMYYNSSKGHVKLWGGIIVENECQALSGVLLKWQFLNIEDRMKEENIVYRLANTVHDEGVNICNEDDAEYVKVIIKEEMSKQAPWCPDLPLNAGVKVSRVYGK